MYSAWQKDNLTRGPDGGGTCLQSSARLLVHLSTAPASHPGAPLGEAPLGPSSPQRTEHTTAFPSQRTPAQHTFQDIAKRVLTGLDD